MLGLPGRFVPHPSPAADTGRAWSDAEDQGFATKGRWSQRGHCALQAEDDAFVMCRKAFCHQPAPMVGLL